jgi:hypothetical protein
MPLSRARFFRTGRERMTLNAFVQKVADNLAKTFRGKNKIRRQDRSGGSEEGFARGFEFALKTLIEVRFSTCQF